MLEQIHEVDARVPRAPRPHATISKAPAATEAPALVAGRALTVLTRIDPERVTELDALLTAIGNDIRNNPHIRFDQLRTVHFMRWAILPRRLGATADYLVLETNYDGTLEAHLADLLSAAGESLHRIYQYSSEYGLRGPRFGPSERVALLAFLENHALPHAAFYVANAGKTLRRIRDEAAVYEEIQRWLDAEGRAARTLAPGVLYHRIREHLRDRGLLERLQTPEPAPPVREHWLRLAGRLLPSLAGPVAALPVLAPLLLLKERTDAVWDPAEFDERLERVPALAAQEDRQVQNPLTHLVAVKPGPLRRFVLQRVLGTIEVLSRHYFNQGDLGGIPTIHFARWVLLENDRLLLFFSNYDGSWENYLGDFIDIASVGLTAVWSNTLKFPRSFLLVGGGARDEERFKSWTRAHQVFTQVWYSAYPTLTVSNVRTHHWVAQWLVSPPTNERDLAHWLSLL